MHIQLHQFFNLLLLLLLGQTMGFVYLSWYQILGLFLFTLFVELLFFKIKKEKYYFNFSSFSTAIGLALMMVMTDYMLYFVVLFLALAQKHWLTYRGQHFFNPSNFALIAGMLLFYKKSHIVVGQLSQEIYLAYVVVVMALIILYRIKRLLIPTVFIGGYLFFQYSMLVVYDPMFLSEDLFRRFSSVSFIVFIFFMLTDPKTTPERYELQVIFSLFLAVLSTLLDYYYGYRVQHLFMVLFILSPLFVFFNMLPQEKENRSFILYFVILLVLVLSAIIYLELQPPYYFAMD